MTEEQKIRAAERRAARRAMQEARAAEEKKDRALVLDTLRDVLKDPAATAAQRLYAVAVLENMMYYHFTPCSVKHPEKDSDALIADFAKRLEAYQANKAAFEEIGFV